MSRARTVVVTGAGGKTGHAVTAALRDGGATVRAVVRSSERAPASSVAVVGDQRDAATLAVALAGADAVVAIAPNLAGADLEMAAALVAACRTSGVRRLVLHSVVHPQLAAMPHHTDKARAEELVITSGLDWTVLQPNAYLQNLAGYVDGLRQGRYRVPYRVDAALAMVDLVDVAEVAARAVLDDLGPHATFELSGPAEVRPLDVAATAARLLDREVVAARVEPSAWAAEHGPADGAARARLVAMLEHYDRHGSPGDATVLAALLGRPPGALDGALGALLVG